MIDLHLHFDGSLLPRTVLELAQEQGILLPATEPDELKLFLAAPEECGSLNEYLEKFDLPGRCIMDEEGLSGAAYDLLSQMNEENVCYAEIRFAPLLSETKKMDSRKVIEAVISGMEQGKKDFGIEYGVIVCAMRHHSTEDNMRMIKTAREYLGSGVCAADLAGDKEDGNAIYTPCRRMWKSTECHRFDKRGSWKDRAWDRDAWQPGDPENGKKSRYWYRDVSDQQFTDQICKQHGGISDAGISGCRLKSIGQHR